MSIKRLGLGAMTSGFHPKWHFTSSSLGINLLKKIGIKLSANHLSQTLLKWKFCALGITVCYICQS